LSLVGPKARPHGVVDGCQVDIPEPGVCAEYVGTLPQRSVVALVVYVPARDEWRRKTRRSRPRGGREKPRRSIHSTAGH
jgi:hypothetical protein